MYLFSSCSITPIDIGDEKLVICAGKCIEGGYDHSVTIPYDALIRLANGEFIQEVLPNISKGDREFLISGASPQGWEIFHDKDSPYMIGHKVVSSKSDLQKINIKWKNDWREIRKILHQNRIKWLYHFTDYSNLQSILKHNGLYSWAYSFENDIEIKVQGGEQWSKEKDEKAKLHDYVRLSFVEEHPMMYVRRSQIKNPVVLKISSDVCFFYETLFADKNTVSSDVAICDKSDNFKNIKFELFGKNYQNLNPEEKKQYQSEVLVKSFIPIVYILNLYAEIEAHNKG
ncbi:MAG: DarT ssDNA thymidine ADP-ribosyltransferase family protein [Cyclobacteriaceae bacterium]